MAGRTLRIVPGEIRHGLYIAEHMRERDKAEIWAASHHTPEQGVLGSFKTSTSVWAGIMGDEVFCMFGVGPANILSGRGSPWLLGTDSIEKYALSFLRHCSWAVDAMHSSYPYLQNWVDVRNTTSINWLKWLGFTIHDPKPFGAEGMLYHRFSKELAR